MWATLKNGLRAFVVATLALVLVGLAAGAAWVGRDSDGDGLSDCRERSGLRTAGGAASYVTDPTSTDTDGDLVPDSEEVGSRTAPGGLRDSLLLLWNCDQQTYEATSDPTRADADFDGLGDATELSEGSDVFSQDSDADGLLDSAERSWGSDPNGSDTDGDGFDDVDDVSEGRTPVVVDELEDRESWAAEYREGLVFGDIRESDTVAQLIGSLSGGASSAIPVAGWVTGSIADTRDTVANALEGRWGDAGMSGAGLLPYVGDAAKAVSKTSRFVARNPRLVGQLTRRLATWDKVPEPIRMKLLGATDRASYEVAVTSKLSDERVVALVARGATLAMIAKLLNQAAGTVVDVRSPNVTIDADGFFASTDDAAAELAAYVGDDTETNGLTYVHAPGTTGAGRLFDACGSCAPQAEPSRSTLYIARLGSQVWSQTLQDQVESDRRLQDAGYEVEWHFFAGPTGLAVDPAVVDALSDAGIAYVVHIPA